MSIAISGRVSVPFRTDSFLPMADLSRERARDRLAPRREPYWQRLAAGAYLGFRRGPDTWLARFRGRDKKQQHHALGDIGQGPPCQHSEAISCRQPEAPGVAPGASEDAIKPSVGSEADLVPVVVEGGVGTRALDVGVDRKLPTE